MPVPPPALCAFGLFAPLRLTLPMRVLIIGSGYVGLPLGVELVAPGT